MENRLYGRILGLEIVRFFACIMVAFHHLMDCYSLGDQRCLGRYGVTIFIILSGFLVGVEDRHYEENTFQATITNIVKKIKKVYIIYFISFILGIGKIIMAEIKGTTTKYLGIKVFTFLLMLQSWIPNAEFYHAINGVAWYLSMIMFLYFLTPLLYRVLGRLRNNTQLLIGGGCIVILLLINIIVSDETEVGTWLLYVCPLVRLFEYVFAITVGRVVKRFHIAHENKKSCLRFTIYELMVIIIAIFFYLLDIPIKYQKLTGYILPSTCLIVVFYFERGKIAELLSNKIVISIASASMSIYLLHQLYFSYLFTINKYILHLRSAIIAGVAFVSIGVLCCAGEWIKKKNVKVIRER